MTAGAGDIVTEYTTSDRHLREGLLRERPNISSNCFRHALLTLLSSRLNNNSWEREKEKSKGRRKAVRAVQSSRKAAATSIFENPGAAYSTEVRSWPR